MRWSRCVCVAVVLSCAVVEVDAAILPYGVSVSLTRERVYGGLAQIEESYDTPEYGVGLREERHALAGEVNYAEAYGNINTGRLGASAVGRHPNAAAVAMVEFWERLTFLVPWDEGELHPFYIDLTGGLSGDQAMGLFYWQVGDVSDTVALIPGDETFFKMVLIPLDKGTTAVDVKFSLALYADGNSVVDYSHTLALDIPTVEGVTWTSASGSFLSERPVPEPASLLVLASLTTVLLVRRRGIA